MSDFTAGTVEEAREAIRALGALPRHRMLSAGRRTPLKAHLPRRAVLRVA